jgi:hypothetical protein
MRPDERKVGRNHVLMFKFDYRLTGPGWSEAKVADEHRHATLSASYLSDALRSLLEAVALIVEGHTDARCSWDEEPGEFRWIFRRADDIDLVELKILMFPQLCGDAPDGDGEEVFRTTQSALRFGRVVLAEAQRLCDEHGEEGYAEQWIEHPFPGDALARLRRAIATSPDRP